MFQSNDASSLTSKTATVSWRRQLITKSENWYSTPSWKQCSVNVKCFYFYLTDFILFVYLFIYFFSVCVGGGGGEYLVVWSPHSGPLILLCHLSNPFILLNSVSTVIKFDAQVRCALLLLQAGLALSDFKPGYEDPPVWAHRQRRTDQACVSVAGSRHRLLEGKYLTKLFLKEQKCFCGSGVLNAGVVSLDAHFIICLTSHVYLLIIKLVLNQGGNLTC